MDTNHLRANMNMMKSVWTPPMTMESLFIRMEWGQKVPIQLNLTMYTTLKEIVVDHLRASPVFDLDLREYEAADPLKCCSGEFKIFWMEKDRLRIRSSFQVSVVAPPPGSHIVCTSL